MSKKNFSVLILTCNEEKSITECINSVSLSNDVVVLDSFSSDRTKEISNSLGVRFFERRFTNYSDQRNYGLHNIEYKNDFVLILDADEIATKKLILELNDICNTSQSKSYDVYFLRREVLFEEKILKWNFTSTVWIERFVKPRKVRYVGHVHEKMMYEGSNGFLKNYIIHDQFSKGISNWIERRKKYALLELNNREKQMEWESKCNSAINSRAKLKNFFINKVPFFYLFYFAYNLFIKLAFLDGWKGLKYISLETYSFYLTSLYKKNAEKHTLNQIPTCIGSEA